MLVAEGLEWLNIYWIKGVSPKHLKHRNAVTDPPCSGWQFAFVMRGEKHSTIFCPYSLNAYTVQNANSEIAQAEEPRQEFRAPFIRQLLEDRWATMQEWGWQQDYDTCALVMKRLSWPVPAQVRTGGGEDTRRKGGKEVGEGLLKPVKRGGKRGKFLAWFLEEAGVRSVREAMAEFSMTRSNALSYLFMLKKDHGIGYELVGDMATVMLPAGCTDPFDDGEKAQPTMKTDALGDPIVKTEDDDSWLD